VFVELDLRQHHLECDLSRESQIVGEIDSGHSATAEATEDIEPSKCRLAQPLDYPIAWLIRGGDKGGFIRIHGYGAGLHLAATRTKPIVGTGLSIAV
jgi:hypothetical protein